MSVLLHYAQPERGVRQDPDQRTQGARPGTDWSVCPARCHTACSRTSEDAIGQDYATSAAEGGGQRSRDRRYFDPGGRSDHRAVVRQSAGGLSVISLSLSVWAAIVDAEGWRINLV